MYIIFVSFFLSSFFNFLRTQMKNYCILIWQPLCNVPKHVQVVLVVFCGTLVRWLSLPYPYRGSNLNEFQL